MYRLKDLVNDMFNGINVVTQENFDKFMKSIDFKFENQSEIAKESKELWDRNYLESLYSSLFNRERRDEVKDTLFHFFEVATYLNEQDDCNMDILDVSVYSPKYDEVQSS